MKQHTLDLIRADIARNGYSASSDDDALAIWKSILTDGHAHVVSIFGGEDTILQVLKVRAQWAA